MDRVSDSVGQVSSDFSVFPRPHQQNTRRCVLEEGVKAPEVDVILEDVGGGNK